ncbi:hypothetical protein NPIL_414111 [Nephila pilipes]|uniref:Uncharacterized protein n=1 Tax=Nephila pilipes TaxID=299642 RepID=A0A8X6QN54_NEPPI|nr:hypothetical protein NPIL_414111 [Nephila pilipes]
MPSYCCTHTYITEAVTCPALAGYSKIEREKRWEQFSHLKVPPSDHPPWVKLHRRTPTDDNNSSPPPNPLILLSSSPFHVSSLNERKNE